MKQKLALLLAVLDSEWRTLDTLFDKLEPQRAQAGLSEADTVLTAYLLHNLYRISNNGTAQVFPWKLPRYRPPFTGR